MIKKLLLILGVIVAVYIGYLVVFNAVEPSFTVDVSRSADRYRLTITPNFVVNSILQIRVSGPQGVLSESTPPRGPERAGSGAAEWVELPPDVGAGTEISVECNLQYDRTFSADATTKSQRLVLP